MGMNEETNGSAPVDVTDIRPSIMDIVAAAPKPSIVQYPVAPQGIAGIAGQMVAAGLSVLEAQQLIAQVQEVAQQAAMAAMPKLLDAVRRVHEERIRDLHREVAAINHKWGWIHRDRVLQLIQMLEHTAPRTSRG